VTIYLRNLWLIYQRKRRITQRRQQSNAAAKQARSQIKRRKRSEFSTTVNELSIIAAVANSGRRLVIIAIGTIVRL
jgi:hypothetical protein